jgi:hypothetical protein
MQRSTAATITDPVQTKQEIKKTASLARIGMQLE